MIVPRSRLLIWFALTVLPAAVLAGVHPPAAAICLAIISAVVVVMVLDAVMARHALEGLHLEAPLLSRLAMGKDGLIELRLQSRTPKSRTVRVALPLPTEFVTACEELVVSIPAGTEWSKFPWACRPQKRGNFSLRSAHLETPSPLGFWSKRRTLPIEAVIRVYPNMEKERAALALMFRGAFGTHALRQVGKGREFEKLRDYVPGDGSEDIHWKATARRGRPVTKVFQIERTQEVYVAIDSSRLSARENAIERHLSSALLIGMAAEQQSDLFGLLSFSDRVEHFVRARNGASHYQACRDAIHSLQPREVNPDFNEACTFIRLRLRRRALVIFLTALDDPVIAEDFLRNVDLIARQHLVIVGMIKPAGMAPLFSRDITSRDELYDQLGGHLRWHRLEELSRKLQRRGVKLAVLDGERMGLRLVSEYLNIKRRQIL